MLSTLHDVCKRSGLSTATVSRVLNGSPLVREQTRARVLEAVEALGYRPSHAARTLARRRTDTIGVIFPEIASGFFSEVLRGIDAAAAEHNFHLMTAFSHSDRDERELVMRTVRERRADALILMNLSLPDDFVANAAGHGMPIVLIDRPAEGANLFAVTLDNFGGADAAMTHLLGHGYRRVAVITGPGNSYDFQQRLAGCLQAAERAGIALSDDFVWQGSFTENSGAFAVARWLEAANRPPEAIFASNDSMALGALGVLRERGLRVPEDVALVGFDNIDAARHLDLTTVSVPMREMGRAAAEAAIHQILSGEAQKHRVLATHLVVRRSCGCSGSNN